MADLLEWLTGCLDHLEAVARAATAGPWEWSGELCWSPQTESCEQHKHDWGHMGPNLDGSAEEGVISSSGYDADQVIVSYPDATHIAAHDPRAVLARVEAERMVMASAQAIPTADWILYELAWGHRFDYPGWRDEWHPEVSRG